MCDVECGQNLLVCLILIRGDEGVDINIREECGCEMGDGPEKHREAGCMLRCGHWPGCLPPRQWDVRSSHFVCCQWDLAGVEGGGAKSHTPKQQCQGRLQQSGVRLSFMGPDCFAGEWEDAVLYSTMVSRHLQAHQSLGPTERGM